MYIICRRQGAKDKSSISIGSIGTYLTQFHFSPLTIFKSDSEIALGGTKFKTKVFPILV